jgi:hypothetical protein
VRKLLMSTHIINEIRIIGKGTAHSFARRNKANSLSLSPYEGEKLIFSLLFKEGLKGEFYQLITINYRI